jgi:hypothetical protein
MEYKTESGETISGFTRAITFPPSLWAEQTNFQRFPSDFAIWISA